MACGLVGAFTEPMLEYCEFEKQEQIPVKS